MSTLLNERDLPVELTLTQAVEVAYSGELAATGEKLTRGLPALVECDKELVPFLFANLRDRLKPTGLKFAYLDGRRVEQANQGPMPAVSWARPLRSCAMKSAGPSNAKFSRWRT